MDVKKIWEQFYDIYKTLQLITPLTSTQLSNLKCDLIQWMSLFTSVYQTKNVTFVIPTHFSKSSP